MSADRTEEVLQQILSQEYWWEDGEDYTSWTVVSGGPADTLRAALASLPVVSPRVRHAYCLRELGVLELAVQYDIVNVYVVPCCRTLRCRRYGRVWRRSGSLQSWKAVGGIYGLTISPCFPNW